MFEKLSDCQKFLSNWIILHITNNLKLLTKYALVLSYFTN